METKVTSSSPRYSVLFFPGLHFSGCHLRGAIQNSMLILSSPKLLINLRTFNNPHQLFWSTSVEVDKAGFPALKEDFVPSAKLACCYIQALNSKDCQKTRSNSKDFQKKKKIQSRRIASRRDWISGKYFYSAEPDLKSQMRLKKK